jgi:hypothetical protein
VIGNDYIPRILNADGTAPTPAPGEPIPEPAAATSEVE